MAGTKSSKRTTAAATTAVEAAPVVVETPVVEEPTKKTSKKRKTESSSSSSAAAVETAPVVEETSVPMVQEEAAVEAPKKSSGGKKRKAAAAPVEEEAAPAPAVVIEETTPVVAVDDAAAAATPAKKTRRSANPLETLSFEEIIESARAACANAKHSGNSVSRTVQGLIKTIDSLKRENSHLERKLAKRRRAPKLAEDGSVIKPRNNGLNTLTSVSPKFAQSFSLPLDTVKPRIELQKVFYKYIRDNNLQNPEKGKRRMIVCNDTLRDLFGRDVVSAREAKYQETGLDKDGISFLSINGLLASHFKSVRADKA